ncbi:MAG: autotransporter outer membrane beta-barrel domain-containing protein [Alphaproteobacteria bacterium]|nr:autotransporter outer membrane beta-barrel domain-containing protein [Alphaproteobacteria bacterium]
MRRFNRFLLAGTSHLAVLMMGAGAVWAWEAAVIVDGSNSPFIGRANVSGPNVANSTDGAGGGSAGILFGVANTSVLVSEGTVSGGRGGDGANGGSGGDSVGIFADVHGVGIAIGRSATVSGGTAGDGGTGGNAYGIYVLDASGVAIDNEGTINGGTGGIDPSRERGDRNSSCGICVGNQSHRGATNTTITNNGTINQGIEYYSRGNTITNNGTINGWVSGDGDSSATITNNGTINHSGDRAVDFYSVTQDSTFTNNGTVTGDIVLGVVANGDYLIYLNEGSTLNGNVMASSPNNGNVVIGSSGAGTANFTGNIGTNNTPIHNLAFATGATLALGGNSAIHTAAWSWRDGATIDLRTHKLNSYSYDTLGGSSDGQSGTFYLKTTIDRNAGQHGYWVSSFGDADKSTNLSVSTVSISPTVVGTASSGQKFVILQDTNGRIPDGLPSVVNSGGYRWAVSSITGAGETDTDGVSYGTGYTNIVITAANLNAAGTASGINGASVNALATYSGSDVGLQALSQAVNNLTSDASIKKAGAQLRPEATINTAQASMGAVSQALSTIRARSDAVRVMASKARTGVSSGETVKGLGVWGQGFGSTAAQDERDDVSGYDADTHGLAFGADFKLADPLRVGLSFAYAKTDVESTGDRSGSGQDIDSYIASLYGIYSGKGWYVDGGLTYGVHKYDATRHVDIAGAAAQSLNASYDGQQLGAKIEAGIPLDIGPAVVTPLASLAYNNLKQDGYSETGGAAALDVGSSSTDSIRSGLGAKVSAKVATIGNWEVSPNARAVWHHEFNKSSQDQTSIYAAGGSSFITPGTDIATEHFNLGLGVDVASVRNTAISAKYDTDLADSYVSHSASLQLRTEF